MPVRYRIVRMRPKGLNRWAVFDGPHEIARFYLKRHAIDWIMQQEHPSSEQRS